MSALAGIDLANVCLLVSSSDNTADVLRQVAPALDKYWPDCPFERFVGVNTAAAADGLEFVPVKSPLLGGWRSEIAHQIAALPAQYTHILLLLDDFLLLEPVDTARVVGLVEAALRRDIAYLRLVPEERSLAGALAHRLSGGDRDAEDGMAELPADTPYYSSLQASLWQRRHLAERLSAEGSIWDFELQRGDAVHYAVAGPPALRYRHVVERGQWMADAPHLFARAGLPFRPGGRTLAGMRRRLGYLWQRGKFAILGYSVFRRRLRRQGLL